MSINHRNNADKKIIASSKRELVHVCTGLGQTKYIYEKNFPRPQCERQELTMPQRTLITPEAGSIWWEIENKEKS